MEHFLTNTFQKANGVTVYMSRKTDIQLDLEERIDMAVETDAGVF